MTPTDFDIRDRGLAECQKLEADGWWFDLSHADTVRFHDTLCGDLALDDLVFVVAVRRDVK